MILFYKLVLSLFSAGIILNATVHASERSISILVDSVLTNNKNPKIHYNILSSLKNYDQILRDIPCISPIQYYEIKDKVTSGYGTRIHPITGYTNNHTAIDLSPASQNDTIYAPANGIIDTISYNPKLGLFIRISHKYGYKSTYGHLHHLLMKSIDEPIEQGTPIAIMGNTGRSTGKHLHYSISLWGTPIDPLPYCYLLIMILRKNAITM